MAKDNARERGREGTFSGVETRGGKRERERESRLFSPVSDSGAREKRPGEGKTMQQTPTSGSKRIAEKNPA